jgi:hypothetical protein
VKYSPCDTNSHPSFNEDLGFFTCGKFHLEGMRFDCVGGTTFSATDSPENRERRTMTSTTWQRYDVT